jgi:hypothetical protein
MPRLNDVGRLPESSNSTTTSNVSFVVNSGSNMNLIPLVSQRIWSDNILSPSSVYLINYTLTLSTLHLTLFIIDWLDIDIDNDDINNDNDNIDKQLQQHDSTRQRQQVRQHSPP